MIKVWFGPAAAIAAVGTAVSVAGTVMQGMNAKNQGNAQGNMYDESASQTQLEEKRARDDLQLQRDRSIASGKASMGAMSGEIDDSLVATQAGLYGKQDARIKDDSLMKQRQLYYRANYVRNQGDDAFTTGLFKAGGQALAGGYNVYNSIKNQS